MIKRLLVVLVVLCFSAQFAVADVGITNPNDLVGVFQYNHDIATKGIGFTMDLGVGIEPGLGGERQYLMTAGGRDIDSGHNNNVDEMHMAYNLISGDVFMSATFDKVAVDHDWAKWGPMLRDPGTDIYDGRNANYFTKMRGKEDKVRYQKRDNYGNNTNSGGDQNVGAGQTADWTLGIQKVDIGFGFSVVQNLVDKGAGDGWQVIGQFMRNDLPDTYMAGIAFTSHKDNGLAQIIAKDVVYETEDLQLIDFELPQVTGAGVDVCSEIPGFKIRVKKKDPSQGWNREEAFKLLDGVYPGDLLDPDLLGQPGWNPTEGVRIDPVVNLHDSDGVGEFGDDSQFPGVDLMKEKGVFPDDADNDNQFAAEVIACIYLTEGRHALGVNDDDGTVITIGGTEIGRSSEWKGASTTNFVFDVLEEGWYDFNARWLEGSGGAALEIHEIFADGSKILLGAMDDQGAFIGSPVYAPEPATIALLGLGGLSLLRRKRS